MHQIHCKVEAIWDVEAQVWIATSPDIPGLATEADTLETLAQKLRNIVPELLQLNQILPEHSVGTVAIELISHRQELIELSAA